jgi:PHD/YefM family antitoxin component YafN of YafNO toxin-antitoxin module
MVSEEVDKEDKPFMVMSNNKPQFVIVSLKFLSHMQKYLGKNNAASLLSLLTRLG